jgi:hypothetical protein
VKQSEKRRERHRRFRDTKQVRDKGRETDLEAEGREKVRGKTPREGREDRGGGIERESGGGRERERTVTHILRMGDTDRLRREIESALLLFFFHKGLFSLGRIV